MSTFDKGKSRTLSKIVSMSEIIINTVAELHDMNIKEVEELFNQSEVKKKLFCIQTKYYMNNIELLLKDFELECEKTNYGK